MKFYETKTTINATPEQIWPVMSDGAGFTSWDSSVLQFDGEIKAGNQVKLVSEVAPKRTFKLNVSECSPPHHFVFSDGMPLGLFKGERTYKLTPKGNQTEFHMREEYTGPLAAMMYKAIPDLQPSFEKFAAGLKAKVEGRST
ncbi:MAG: SRPBCC domain-containing protein [Acidimicrobiia bacterium]|nr:SRPBCC domain-containing protein [Acidimicrobiia bacterium]